MELNGKTLKALNLAHLFQLSNIILQHKTYFSLLGTSLKIPSQ
jgi:hypothetical protein